MRCLRPRSIQAHSSARHDAGDEVEGKNALGAGGIAVDVEGDAQLEQDAFGGRAGSAEIARHRAIRWYRQGVWPLSRGRPLLSNISS